MAKGRTLLVYVSDWTGDPKLSMCSLAARGLWWEMLLIMQDADPFGHLSVNRSVIRPDELARLVKSTPEEVEALLAVLEGKGIFSRTDEGMIYSRRMLKDQARRETNQRNGNRGGNPNLKQSDKPSVESSDNRKGEMSDNPKSIQVQVPSIDNSSGRERAGKFLFANSRYSDPAVAAASLADLIAKGANIPGLAEKIRNWSDAKDERRTDRGWLATYRTFYATERDRSAPPSASDLRKSTITDRNTPIELGPNQKQPIAKAS